MCCDITECRRNICGLGEGCFSFRGSPKKESAEGHEIGHPSRYRIEPNQSLLFRRVRLSEGLLQFADTLLDLSFYLLTSVAFHGAGNVVQLTLGFLDLSRCNIFLCHMNLL